MKKFFITYTVDVNVDNYDEGIIEDNVDYYSGDYETEADTARDAIVEFFETELSFNINIDSIKFDDENNCFNYSFLCDEYRTKQVSENDAQFKEWQEGKINLYANNVSFKIYKLENISKI